MSATDLVCADCRRWPCRCPWRKPKPLEERDLTLTEQALVRVRLSAFAALEAGATRDQVNAEVADAHRLRLRMIARDRPGLYERTDTP